MDETQMMTLLVDSGNAKSLAIEAYRAARDGDLEKADQLIKEAEQGFIDAHHIQTDLIQAEMSGASKLEMSLLIVHAQDHLMCGMTVLDLVKEMIEDFRNRK